MSTKDLDDPLKLYGAEAIATHGQAEILRTEPPKRPLINFLRSIVETHTRGGAFPDKICLNERLYERFLSEFIDAAGAFDGKGIAVLLGVPIYPHNGSQPTIVYLPDYGVGE